MKVLFNDFIHKNGGYAFLIRMNLMFSISLQKDFQLLQILDDLSIRNLIRLILYENDVKLLKFKRSPVFIETSCICQSFTSFSYKISLITCLIDRSFKIYNNWKSFHNDIENIKSNLIKNAYPPFLINKVIKKYLDYKFSSTQTQLKDKCDFHYFKLPYIDNLLHHIKNKISKLSKEFCKEHFNIKFAFSSFKIKKFSYKDLILNDLKSFLVYKFTCASCSSSYIDETCHHFKIRIEEHIKRDNKSHILKHLHSTATCFDSYNSIILFVLK